MGHESTTGETVAAASKQTMFVETNIANPPGDTAQMKVDIIGGEIKGNHIQGHLVTLANPLGRVSIREPPNGCGTFEKTSVTSMARDPKCLLAINAGYFDVHSGACIGNVVVDGRQVQKVPLSQSNVNFGIRNGKFFIGYATDEDFRNGFDTLVSGVTWLVRNEKNYVEQGWKEANTTVQTSGDKYSVMHSSRGAVGWDKDGALIILQIDGSHAHEGIPGRGMNMYELADRLIQHGAIEAINLDGGGSTAMVRDGVLINYPSDKAPPSCDSSGLYQCERKVSTILCISEANTGGGGSWPMLGGPIALMSIGILAGVAATMLYSVFTKKSHKQDTLGLAEASHDEESMTKQ